MLESNLSQLDQKQSSKKHLVTTVYRGKYLLFQVRLLPPPPQEFVDEVKKDVKIAITFEENRTILSHVKLW